MTPLVFPDRNRASAFRNVTRAMLLAQELADKQPETPASRNEVSTQIKRAAKALGLRGTPLVLVDFLLGHSPAETWEIGQLPVVGLPNHYIADRLCISERTVARALKTLAEAGLIGFLDSPSGRRWVKRDKRGTIVEAYGISFAPARHRYRELKAMADRYAEEQAAARKAAREIRRTLRAIKDLEVLALADGIVFDAINDRIAAVLSAVMDDASRADALEDIRKAALAELGANAETPSNPAENEKELSGYADKPVSPIHITTHEKISICNKKRTCADAQDKKFADDALGVELALEKEPCGALDGTQPRPRRGDMTAKTSAAKGRGDSHDKVSIDLVRAAFGAVQGGYGVDIRNGQDLVKIAQKMAKSIHIRDKLFSAAATRHGQFVAAVCVLIVAEKGLRDPDAIKSPGGYFRGMLAKAESGGLNLTGTLYGLATDATRWVH